MCRIASVVVVVVLGGCLVVEGREKEKERGEMGGREREGNGDGGRSKMISDRRELTEAINNPKAPPRANPIVPAITVFPGHDSMIICI